MSSVSPSGSAASGLPYDPTAIQNDATVVAAPIISYSQMEAVHGDITQLSSVAADLSSLLAPFQLADMNVASILATGMALDDAASDPFADLFSDSNKASSPYADSPGG